MGGEFRPGTFDGTLKIGKEEKKWRTEETGFLENYFGLRQHGTTVRTEVLAGVTTFIAITAAGLREAIIRAIPDCVKAAITP